MDSTAIRSPAIKVVFCRAPNYYGIGNQQIDSEATFEVALAFLEQFGHWRDCNVEDSIADFKVAIMSGLHV